MRWGNYTDPKTFVTIGWILRKTRMTQPTAQPQYLPAVDRQLEHRAGLPTATPPPNPELRVKRTRQWLGTDFTHSVAVR